jgi:hypothetical protein
MVVLLEFLHVRDTNLTFPVIPGTERQTENNYPNKMEAECSSETVVHTRKIHSATSQKKENFTMFRNQ